MTALIEKFAHLYEFPEIGQVLIKLDVGEDGPEVRTYIKPEGLGVCSLAVGFEDNDDGWKLADKMFGEMQAEQARNSAMIILNQIKGWG
jgi:hypothetical protein